MVDSDKLKVPVTKPKKSTTQGTPGDGGEGLPLSRCIWTCGRYRLLLRVSPKVLSRLLFFPLESTFPLNFLTIELLSHLTSRHNLHITDLVWCFTHAYTYIYTRIQISRIYTHVPMTESIPLYLFIPSRKREFLYFIEISLSSTFSFYYFYVPSIDVHRLFTVHSILKSPVSLNYLTIPTLLKVISNRTTN